jgi:hypothetical protein
VTLDRGIMDQCSSLFDRWNSAADVDCRGCVASAGGDWAESCASLRGGHPVAGGGEE